MKHHALPFIAAAALLTAGILATSACNKEDEPSEHHYTEYDDSTGLAITDSITVIFGDQEWKTLTYTVSYEEQEMSSYRWAVINAHKPGRNYPAFKLHLFLEPGNHSSYLTINDPGLGYTVPGALTGDSKGGALYYFEKGYIYSPDGTYTSDWWPLEITTSVLKYNNQEGELTARVTAKMFEYRTWLDGQNAGENINVSDCAQKTLSVTFGGLKLSK